MHPGAAVYKGAAALGRSSRTFFVDPRALSARVGGPLGARRGSSRSRATAPRTGPRRWYRAPSARGSAALWVRAAGRRARARRHRARGRGVGTARPQRAGRRPFGCAALVVAIARDGTAHGAAALVPRALSARVGGPLGARRWSSRSRATAPRTGPRRWYRAPSARGTGGPWVRGAGRRARARRHRARGRGVGTARPQRAARRPFGCAALVVALARDGTAHGAAASVPRALSARVGGPFGCAALVVALARDGTAHGTLEEPQPDAAADGDVAAA
jgi:hypothetical protein